MNVENASAYSVDYFSRKILSYFLLDTIGGSVAIDPMTRQPLDYGKFDHSYAGLDGAATHTLWLASNSTSTMSSKLNVIADTFTSYMRTNLAAAPEERYAPAVSNTEIFVRVRWLWLAYPLCLVIASYVFLIATIVQTQRRAVHPWKSQRLPLLLADVDDIIHELDGRGSHGNDSLDERAGDTRVQMDFDEQNGLSFKRARLERPTSHQAGSELQLLGGLK